MRGHTSQHGAVSNVIESVTVRSKAEALEIRDLVSNGINLADQRIAKAEMALIVSNVLPKGVEAFDLIDNVWVSEPRFAVPLAIALRQSLIDVAGSRLAQEGQQTKMEMVYQYLTGPRFRHRIDAIVE